MAYNVGMIIPFYGTGTSIPKDFEPCDGHRFSFGEHGLLYNLLIRSANNDLLKLDPTKPFGAGNALPAGVIRVPDLRGEFIRGFYGSTDPGGDPPKFPDGDENRVRALGSRQREGVREHDHLLPFAIKIFTRGETRDEWHRSNDRGSDHNEENMATAGERFSRDVNKDISRTETRPMNVAVQFLICAEGLVASPLHEVLADPRGPIPKEMIAEAKEKHPELWFP